MGHARIRKLAFRMAVRTASSWGKRRPLGARFLGHVRGPITRDGGFRSQGLEQFKVGTGTTLRSAWRPKSPGCRARCCPQIEETMRSGPTPPELELLGGPRASFRNKGAGGAPHGHRMPLGALSDGMQGKQARRSSREAQSHGSSPGFHIGHGRGQYRAGCRVRACRPRRSCSRAPRRRCGHGVMPHVEPVPAGKGGWTASFGPHIDAGREWRWSPLWHSWPAGRSSRRGP